MIAPPLLLTYRALTLTYTYHAPSRSFACFFDTALSFVSYSTKTTLSPSHVQNGPYYVPYRFMAPFYVPFPHCFAKDETQILAPYNDCCTKTKRKVFIDRYCTSILRYYKRLSAKTNHLPKIYMYRRVLRLTLHLTSTYQHSSYPTWPQITLTQFC